jgi:hypothetical protein
MNELKLTFTLSLDQANLVMAALGKLPYEASASVIALLQQQADPQVKEAQANHSRALEPIAD